ncbi:amino acid adenylation domain-containing protein [Massilia sp. PAMC28688]|uniref:non-ribosomal peptide synthetase n=1 Tax=Massilia sp. PAMC28688 TaxID=2861283 RepID=UPI001C63B6DE|nr:non-ribosomal peptide synthetase [Massilia sp. PAMC28688]QYF92619.1 amino acid adenylation domain-containing protein [Massilia sp. PAMC28688]
MPSAITTVPLTIAQNGLWFLSQVDEHASASYNMVFAFESAGALDAGLMRTALAQMTDRHEVLRAAVRAHGGIAQLEVAAPGTALEVPLYRVAGSVREVARSESATPLDLARLPCYRALLVEAGAEPGGLVLSIPHLIFDDASATTFFDELAQRYCALAQYSALPAAPAAASLHQIVQRETAYSASPAGRAAVSTVVARLLGMPARLALPRRRAASASLQACPAASTSILLPPQTLAQVHAAARRMRVTPAAMYLAAYQILLSRYSGQNDFGIVMPVANRGAPAVQYCLAYLINLCVVRAQLDNVQSVGALVASVSDQLMDLQDENEVPFPLIAKQLRRAGQDVRGALSQIGFNYLRSGRQGWQFGAHHLNAVEVAPAYLKNEFKLDVLESEQGARCLFLYDRNGFEPALVERMAGHYAVLLNAVAADPLCALKRLPMLGAAEQDRLRAWSGAELSVAAACAGVHLLFEQQAARTPGARALLWGEHCLSYGELDERANQLAHHLRALGVLPDTLVALCVEPGPEMVVGMLAILKAGAAYVPLDPDYPPQRLAYMLDDCAATVLLTEQHLQARLPRRLAHTVCLDAARAAIACHPTYATGVATPGQRLAYCIYTSGSTGQPKGAVNTHAGVSNLLHWYRHGPASLGRDDRVMLASSLSFDLTQKNILGTLAAGATLIIPQGPASDPDSFRRALQQHQPTHVNCAPSAWRAYAAGLSSHGALRRVVLGGEAIDATLAADLADAGLDLVNSYGPTECADVALSYLNAAAAARTDVPLGRPIPGVQVYIVDGANQPVPAGVAGEICIGGAGVARGYWRRPDLTAERFVPDPFGAPGSRMYRSGDLGRWLADGSVAFLGRLDHQVKLRGMRIEPGEIEAALLRCPGVGQALVMVREDQPGEQKLVAYVTRVTGAGAAPAPAVLHAQLAASLPAYMLPGAWVVLDTLPLNPNGKTDRAALPAPDASHYAAAPAYVAPRSAQERRVAAIWATLLKLAQVGLQDNFFMLGGHSLLAAQVLSQVGDQLGMAVPMRLLFDAPTLADFAHALDLLAAQPGAIAPRSGPIQRQARGRATQQSH